MKYKTLFRVLLKFMAVWIFFEGLALGATAFMNTIMWVLQGDFDIFYMFPEIIWGICQMGIALYLFFGGKWIVDMAIPGNRPYCHECGYDLSHSPGAACPECGTAFNSASQQDV